MNEIRLIGALLNMGVSNITGDPVSVLKQGRRLNDVARPASVELTAEDRFAQFVKRARPGLTRALTAHHSPLLATDLVAEALAYAWMNWERIEALHNPAGYLFRLADRLGQRQSSSAAREQATDPQHLHTTPWFDSETNAEIAASLGCLPRRQRAAVLLIHAYGYTYRETAVLLDLPVTTVTNDAIRGIRALRTFRGKP